MPQTARQASLGFIFLTVIIDVLGGGIITLVLPKLIESFEGGNIAQASNFYGLLIALYSLMSFLFASFIGALSDRFGRRPVLLLSLLGLAVDYTIIALAPNLAWLVVGRVIAGVLGASFVTATAYIADISAPQDRAKNFGVLGAAFGLGFIVGPLLGGLLGGVDIRLPFWVAAGLAALNMLYGLFVLPESLKPEHRRPLNWKHANPLGALVGPLVAKFGERKVVVWGVAISVLAYVLYGFASQPWMLYLGIVLSSAGGVVSPAIQGAESSRVAPDQQGLLQGALASLNNLTNVLAPPLVAGLFAFALARGVSVGLPLFLCAAFEIMAFALAWRAFGDSVMAESSPEIKPS